MMTAVFCENVWTLHCCQLVYHSHTTDRIPERTLYLLRLRLRTDVIEMSVLMMVATTKDEAKSQKHPKQTT